LAIWETTGTFAMSRWSCWEGGEGGDLTRTLLPNNGGRVKGGGKWACNPHLQQAEPESVNLLRSPGIDSQPAGPVRQPYLAYRHARRHRLAESITWNRFLGS
jgi:hypothetical protein